MSIFKVNDGLKYSLECRWNNGSLPEYLDTQEPVYEFPVHKKELIERYCEIESLLNRDWHPDATLGAAIKGDGLLTDHGVDHIKAVMQNAHAIIGKNVENLTGYEIYILLLAIHFHDLGNIYGREEHEARIDEVIDKLGSQLPLDNVEKEFVVAIAKAHGGYVNENKDTIRYISVDDTCNGVKVRAKKLAALLRFADEISDDFSRTTYTSISIPAENKVFHTYSETLEPISIEGETIKFHFRIPYIYTQQKLGKGDKTVYLYDEIRDRLAKCMRELEYCRKYASDYIRVTTLNVSIDILDEGSHRKIKNRASFRLRLLGYPNEKFVNLEDFIENDLPYPFCDNNEPRIFKNGLELKEAMSGEGGMK